MRPAIRLRVAHLRGGAHSGPKGRTYDIESVDSIIIESIDSISRDERDFH